MSPACGGCTTRNQSIGRRHGGYRRAVSITGPDGECMRDGEGNCRVWLDSGAAVKAARAEFGGSDWQVVPATV